jgi:hypothetical protein
LKTILGFPVALNLILKTRRIKKEKKKIACLVTPCRKGLGHFPAKTLKVGK